MTDKLNGCYGCYVGETCVVAREIGGCPCLICIIKMVCDETCEEFETFHKDVWDKYDSEKRYDR